MVADVLTGAVASFEGAVVPAALRAVSAALGDVRTTVAVSLRGTAFLVASAAACGVTPIDVVGWATVPVAAEPLVCADTAAAPITSAVLIKNFLDSKLFMVCHFLVG